MASKDWKIFRLNRLRFNEMADDAWEYLRTTYGVTREDYSIASPFAMLINTVIHLGRFILYFIEDAMTNNSIATSYRPDSIRSLAWLTGHQAARPRSARGACRISFNNAGDMEYSGEQTVCFLPNRISLTSAFGVPYVLLFNSDGAKMTIGGPDTPAAGNYVDGFLVQGIIRTQRATGTGLPMQSYNFSERNYRQYDQDWVIVYVNGKPWRVVNSFLDMTYNEEAVVVQSSAPGTRDGLSLFFGNGEFGAIPPDGAVIIVEVIVSDALAGNLDKSYANGQENFWRIDGQGFLSNGDTISLNENFKITLLTHLMLGATAEDLSLTQRLAPHASRSFVLATETSYKYFLGKMNIFSTIEVLTGRSNKEANIQAQISLEKITRDYNNSITAYQDEIAISGETSDATLAKYEIVQNNIRALRAARERVESTSLHDNTVYLLLIPDPKKRIASTVNYFTCSEDVFTLTKDEQNGIIELIETSQQAMITLEHRILQPKVARFAINVNAKLWEGYDVNDVYAAAIEAVSTYFMDTQRKDMIPLSDIVALMESIEGIDSVKVWFDADVNNAEMYGEDDFYGIDEFGDVILTRRYVSGTGENKKVRDILPLFRGGFMSKTGIEYSNVQSPDYLSAFNLNVVSYTINSKLSLDNPLN